MLANRAPPNNLTKYDGGVKKKLGIFQKTLILACEVLLT